MNTIKFFYNGIKINGGKLQTCKYSCGNYTASSGIPDGTITIYKKYNQNFESLCFSENTKGFFTLENNSDGMTDYFESDKIRVYPNHPLYPEVLKALEARQNRIAKKYA